jgi:hypothetical protein
MQKHYLSSFGKRIYRAKKLNLRKAENQGVFSKESSGRTILQNLWQGIIEFDGGN